MVERISPRMITEPSREVKVCRETDVIVVGAVLLELQRG